MTKSEVRSVSIAELELTEDAIVYDIGAGTGSVSIEIARAGEQIRVYAIEKNPEGVETDRSESEEIQDRRSANHRRACATGIRRNWKHRHMHLSVEVRETYERLFNYFRRKIRMYES